MGDGSADFCLFGKLEIKEKYEISVSRYTEDGGKLTLGSQSLHLFSSS